MALRSRQKQFIPSVDDGRTWWNEGWIIRGGRIVDGAFRWEQGVDIDTASAHVFGVLYRKPQSCKGPLRARKPQKK